jgi:hypothetical protein
MENNIVIYQTQEGQTKLMFGWKMKPDKLCNVPI